MHNMSLTPTANSSNENIDLAEHDEITDSLLRDDFKQSEFVYYVEDPDNLKKFAVVTDYKAKEEVCVVFRGNVVGRNIHYATFIGVTKVQTKSQWYNEVLDSIVRNCILHGTKEISVPAPPSPSTSNKSRTSKSQSLMKTYSLKWHTAPMKVLYSDFGQYNYVTHAHYYCTTKCMFFNRVNMYVFSVDTYEEANNFENAVSTGKKELPCDRQSLSTLDTLVRDRPTNEKRKPVTTERYDSSDAAHSSVAKKK